MAAAVQGCQGFMQITPPDCAQLRASPYFGGVAVESGGVFSVELNSHSSLHGPFIINTHTIPYPQYRRPRRAGTI